ncbi:hypothetical protein QQS21_010820 [Conoideocrella luteorostrata]|uniref:N-acetylgalactosaminide beta-1,3-galactosyltransferase n=1 Tax=Conoideocrella luteorostrata TaxID=1105319 RepID=A0AAJ0CEE7_9HYPO|nr:hypothetical protein QQS21_010820 [Conoideocrella luteorostrata]
MGKFCEDGSYCDVSGLRKKLPSFGNNEASGNTTNDKTHSGSQHVPSSSQSATLSDECANFPNTSSVLTVMKTGASEAYSKIPTQLMTNLKCLPDFLVFSDMAQKIGGYTIHDSLDTVLNEVKQTNKDFDLYHRQKKCPIDQEQCNKNHDTAKQGWDLDKYKNIHMAEKAYHMRPDYDWYLFIDADTYVAFPNLVEWLKELDPNKPHYIGSVAYLGSLPFGHGGSGYLVSKAAMHAMFYGKTGVANKYDEPVQHVCCGDAMWSQALKDETGIEVVNAWPVINGEKPHTLPYAEDEWCHPIVTMHHAVAEEISDLYAFERERKFSKPLRIKDLYHRFMSPHLIDARPDWDNLSEDVYYLNTSIAQYEEWEVNRAKKDGLSNEEAEAYKSFDDCKTACLSLENCFQFRFQNNICGMAHKFKHGKPTKKGDDDSKRYMSGWNTKKIKQWIEKQKDCDKSFKWPVKDTWGR